MLYPFVFKPILKEVIWGGTDIRPYKELPPSSETIGESWELSHVENNFSIVANGDLEGKTIDDLIKDYGAQLLGDKVIQRFGTTFPLLIKFIDARDNLSIQVHPNDELARKRHNSFGKTEMWYVIKASDNAALYSGFSKQIDAGEYVKRVTDNTLVEVLKRYEVKAGDVFFLPAGRVHAIGAGCFIAEIQQTSNITYRIYDYNRKDAAGNSRELHTELAKDAIDYTLQPDYRTNYTERKNENVGLVRCQYFTTNLLDIDKARTTDLSNLGSFIIYICLEGKVSIRDNNENEVTIHKGQTVLIPANTANIHITPENQAKLLESYIE